MVGVRSQPTLGEFLVREGLITQKQLQQVVSEQKNNSRSVGRLLVDRGFITEELRMSMLLKRFGFESISLKAIEIEPLLLMLVPHAFAEKHHVVPVRKDDEDTLVVAMEDPSDSDVIETMKGQLGLRVKPYAATREDIQAVLNAYTRQEEIQHAVADFEESKKSILLKIVRYVFFPLMLVLPVVLYLIDLQTGSIGIEGLIHTTKVGERLTRWDMVLYIVVGWGVWGMVTYEINGLMFGKKKKTEDEEEE